MRPELDEALCAKYPKIFRDRNGNMQNTLLCFGFPGSGWYNLIDTLCGTIQSHINQSKKQRVSSLRYNRALQKAINGDKSALVKYFTFRDDGIPSEYSYKSADEHLAKAEFRDVPAKIKQVIAAQVKEKFGGLRFYYDGGDDQIFGMVYLAENMSYKICEVCGNSGKSINNKGWVRTVCNSPECNKSRDY
jgi:hypothetical protein